ncbi:MAG: hypothetical protein AAFO69_03220, partial [Bacteroidota bacterium]
MNIVKYIRLHQRKVAVSLMLLFTIQLLSPLEVMALGSGPSQPEFQEFEPASTTEMVNPFTGDFTYNIPLFELPGPNGGYPFNLAYHAGISADQEASWVGLGWSLNPGAITRQVRGLPDDFNGDEVQTTRKMKPNRTYGVGFGMGVELLGLDRLKTNVGLNIMHNNYNGISYSVDANLGFPLATGSDKNATLGLDISLDSNEGLSLRPGFSLSRKDPAGLLSWTDTQFSLGVGYHSRYGLSDLSFGLSKQKSNIVYGITKKGKLGADLYESGSGFSSSISLANSGFTPAISHPTVGINTAFTVKSGGAWWSVFPNANINGFYNEQNFKDIRSSVKAFGYENLQNAGEDDLMDFNRERDGRLHKEAPNLPVPSLTHDVYSVTGQGVGVMFKPMRRDVGIIHDNRIESHSTSGSLGLDLGPAVSHLGVNLGLNYAHNTSGKWNLPAQSLSARFRSSELNSLDEPWYYKVRGEHTILDKTDYDNNLADTPIDINLSQSGDVPVINWGVEGNEASQKRVSKASTVVAFTNEELFSGAGRQVINLFKTSTINDNIRQIRPPHHVGAYLTTSSDGLRYVYAIPVYNSEKEEVIFGTSHDNGEEDITESDTRYYPGTPSSNEAYYVSTKTPGYAHSYLLTAVVGPDYVDVNNNGVDDADLGYWIKFNYTRTASDLFVWKTPYTGAIFNQGTKFDTDDNRGSYQIGKKEIWYLDQVESKTHLAKFTRTDRDDNGPASYPGSSVYDVKTKRLDHITLFAKDGEEEGAQLLKIKFDNDHYTLCKNVPNHANYNPATTNEDGKLTLKGIHFEYGSSTKRLNEYRFEYAHNSDYDKDNVDRWGFYNESRGAASTKVFPYVDQTEGAEATADRNEFAAMWSMTDIYLPSGSKIHIDYEMDDYAYVQHKQAMKMTPITSSSLEQMSMTVDNGAYPYQEYLDSLNGDDIYFRALVLMKDDHKEWVSGYLTPDYESDATNRFDFPLGTDINPIRKRAFEHMRTNVPRMVSDVGPDETLQVFPAVRLLVAAGEEVKKIFKGFNNFAKGKGWAASINPGKAWARLPVLSGYKYGGGHRVKRIMIRDAADANAPAYGQIYDYTIEENGRRISSGVAEN